MTRIQLLNAIDDRFYSYIDEDIESIEILRDSVRLLVSDFCDEIAADARRMSETIDKVLEA